jgi:hypothetical protein
MKALLLLLVCTVHINAWAQKAERGPHQGQMKQAGHYKIELFGCTDHIEVYLLDKEGQAMSNYDIKGKVNFVFKNKKSQEILLQPYGRDGFSAKIPQSDFFNCTVTIEILSSPITASFESECTHVTDSK